MSSYGGSGATGQGYVRYLTDWTGRFGPSVVILPAERRPTLLVPSGHDELYIKEAFPWVERGLVEGPANYGKVARRILEQEAKGAIGLVGEADLPRRFYHDLVDNNALEFPAADALLDSLRLTKDSFELDRHRRAAQLSDHMLERLVEVLPGFRGPAWQLMAEIEYAGRKRGAEIANCWLVTGQPADRPRYRMEENEREVRPGDQVLVGTYVTYRGYWGHCLRMGSIGKPTDAYRKIYEATLAQHRAAASCIRIGENAHQIQVHADELAETLLPNASRHPARSRHGHFMGLDYADKPTPAAFPQPPFWSQLPPAPPAGVPLRSGMVLEVHTMLGQEANGLGFIGDVYLARDGGPERLTRFPQDLFVV
jgi:Xaa-Pro aminopeptidase